MERLSDSLNNLSIHFAQGMGPRNPQPPQRAPERDTRPRQVLICWNCNEDGHGMNNCPYPRMNPPGRANIPYPVMNAGDAPRGPQRILQRGNPLPPQERQPLPIIQEEAAIPPLPNANVSAIEVTKAKGVIEKIREEMEINGVKRTRGNEAMEEETQPEGERKK